MYDLILRGNLNFERKDTYVRFRREGRLVSSGRGQIAKERGGIIVCFKYKIQEQVTIQLLRIPSPALS